MSPSITIVPLSYFSSIGLLFLYINYIHIIYLNIFFLFGYVFCAIDTIIMVN
jgi:hypothetical protein